MFAPCKKGWRISDERLILAKRPCPDRPLVSSSPPERPDTASSAPSSIEYMERSSAPLVKDYTVRFLSCLIHCVLNYSQSIAKEGPFIQYRDERLGYTYNSGARKGFEAIDDGGVQLEWPRNKRQVALPEAKRSFQDITNGRPTVSDKLLGQIVGEALASKLFKDCNISTEK